MYTELPLDDLTILANNRLLEPSADDAYVYYAMWLGLSETDYRWGEGIEWLRRAATTPVVQRVRTPTARSTGAIGMQYRRVPSSGLPEAIRDLHDLLTAQEDGE